MVDAYPSYLGDLEPSQPALLTVSGLRKSFGSRSSQVAALNAVELAVYEGELLSLLGPAGSGKSAVLSVVAGVEKPDSGRILLAGEEVPKGSHAIGLASTAFAPRHTVHDVLTAALKTGGVGRRETDAELGDVLKRIGYPGDPEARAGELPAQQQLLVALAAQAAAGAQVVLLDDPLNPVDRTLRDRVQDEIRVAQEEFGLTLVVATRNAQQALSLSDRIAVILDGRIVQTGPPQEVYELPASEEVAALIGPVNLIPPAASVQLLAQAATFSVRPEKIRIVGEGHLAAPDEVLAGGTVLRTVYGGPTSTVTVRLDAEGVEVQVLRLNSTAPEEIPVVGGQRVTVVWPRRHAVRFA